MSNLCVCFIFVIIICLRIFCLWIKQMNLTGNVSKLIEEKPVGIWIISGVLDI